MKTIISLTIWMLFFFQTMGQNVSILDNTLKWNIGYHCVNEGPMHPYDKWTTSFLHIEGDTLMNGKHFKKIMNCVDSLCEAKSMRSYIREDAHQVFLANKTEELIQYDFNLQQGDTMIMDFLIDVRREVRLYIRVDSVRSMIMQDQKERIAQYVTVFNYYKSQLRDQFINDVFIEGIGSLKFGLIYPILFITGDQFCDPTLLCFSSGEDLIYSNPELNSCYLSTSMLTVNVGNDTTYCADQMTTSIPMGLKVNVKNGVAPYTYAWECKIVPYGTLKPKTASDILNDSTLMVPTLADGVWLYAADKIKFILHVTDHAGNQVKDSLNVWFSSCGCVTGYQVIELAQGDSVFLDAGKPQGSIAALYWEPKFGLSTPDKSATWSKPTVTTDYNIVKVDTSGCICSCHAYQIRIIPTSAEVIKSNGESDIQPFQKGSKVYFNNRKNQEASISVFSLDGKLLFQCTTTNDSSDIFPDLAKKGTYVVKISIEGKVGVCKYFKY